MASSTQLKLQSTPSSSSRIYWFIPHSSGIRGLKELHQDPPVPTMWVSLTHGRRPRGKEYRWERKEGTDSLGDLGPVPFPLGAFIFLIVKEGMDRKVIPVVGHEGHFLQTRLVFPNLSNIECLCWTALWLWVQLSLASAPKMSQHSSPMENRKYFENLPICPGEGVQNCPCLRTTG